MMISQDITFNQITLACHCFITHLWVHRLSFIEDYFFFSQLNILPPFDGSLLFENLPIKPGFPWKELCAEEEVHMFMSINPKGAQYFLGPKM